MYGALDRMMFPPRGTKQHIHPSVSASLGVTSSKSTGTFCTSVCAPVASNLAVASPPFKYKTGRHCYNSGGVTNGFAIDIYKYHFYTMVMRRLTIEINGAQECGLKISN